MSGTESDLVTGAFSYSGSRIAERLLESGRAVRTLTFHPEREHPLRERVQTCPYRFDSPVALARSLQGVDTLYNTYLGPVRLRPNQVRQRDLQLAGVVPCRPACRGAARRSHQHREPIDPVTAPLLPREGARRAGLGGGRDPVFDRSPDMIFGDERDVLTNNIAWILRRLPVFAVPGSGRYPVQPVHVDDLARICVYAANADGDVIVDAGPETSTFDEVVQAIRRAVGPRAPILHLPPLVMSTVARALGLLLGDASSLRTRSAALRPDCWCPTSPLSDRSPSANGWPTTAAPSGGHTPTSSSVTSRPSPPDEVDPASLD